MRADVPVQPGREQAHAWAASELAHREYDAGRPGLLARLLTWLLDRLQALPGPGNGLSTVLIVVLLVFLIAAVGWALHRAGGLRRDPAPTERPGLGGTTRPAADHRSEADRLAAAGDWAGAVLERFRAVARRLEEEAVLVPQPSRTADEVAREAGARLPEVADGLAAAARLFDGVRYGGRPASAGDDARLRELDAGVARARPVAGASL